VGQIIHQRLLRCRYQPAKRRHESRRDRPSLRFGDGRMDRRTLRSSELKNFTRHGDRFHIHQYAFMRTTIDLPDELIREVKAITAGRGASLKTVIRAAVEEEARKMERKAGRGVKSPLLSSHEPGSLNLTNADIEDLSA